MSCGSGLVPPQQRTISISAVSGERVPWLPVGVGYPCPIASGTSWCEVGGSGFGDDSCPCRSHLSFQDLGATCWILEGRFGEVLKGVEGSQASGELFPELDPLWKEKR